jgi:hypothetical protein
MKRVFVVLSLVAFAACCIACGGGGGGGGSGTGGDTSSGGGSVETTAADRARAKWKSRIAAEKAAWERECERAKAAFTSEVKTLEANVKRAESDLEKAKAGAPTGEFAKRIKVAEDNVRRAKDAVEFAAKRDSDFNKREAKKLLEAKERELDNAKVAHIAKAERDLINAREARAKPFTEPPFNEPRFPPNTLQVGDVAKLGSGPGLISLFEVFQVIDTGNALLKHGDDLYWGEFNTRGIADKDTIKLEGLVECTGTRQYTTPLGTTKTVRVLHEY